MSTLMINDLTMGKELDRDALTNLTGRGEWHLLSRTVATGAWSSYSRLSKQYVGTTFHDGYLSRKYRERWLRKRTQYEYTTWCHYVRV